MSVHKGCLNVPLLHLSYPCFSLGSISKLNYCSPQDSDRSIFFLRAACQDEAWIPLLGWPCLINAWANFMFLAWFSVLLLFQDSTSACQSASRVKAILNAFAQFLIILYVSPRILIPKFEEKETEVSNFALRKRSTWSFPYYIKIHYSIASLVYYYSILTST